MAPWPSGAGASGVKGSKGVNLSLGLVPYPMGSSGANGANAAASNGANTPVRMGKPSAQSVSQYPIDQALSSWLGTIQLANMEPIMPKALFLIALKTLTSTWSQLGKAYPRR